MSVRQKTIQALVDRLVADGTERGLQVAAYLDGRLVVNAWAGIADFQTGRPVEEDTLFPVFSTTKGMVATVIHILVERGRLSYDEPISKIWPEFGARGKERITLRQALNHTSGIPQMPVGIGFAELCDWGVMCGKIAGLEPLWPPGTWNERLCRSAIPAGCRTDQESVPQAGYHKMDHRGIAERPDDLIGGQEQKTWRSP